MEKFLIIKKPITKTKNYCENKRTPPLLQNSLQNSLQNRPKREVKDSICLYSDGACRGNGSKKSKSGAGAVLLDENKNVIGEFKKYLGRGLTNNIAEYKGLILGLENAIKLGIKSIHVYVDSKLICEQIKGNYRINKPHLKSLFDEVVLLKNKFNQFRISSVLRSFNTHADRLANESIDDYRFREQS